MVKPWGQRAASASRQQAGGVARAINAVDDAIARGAIQKNQDCIIALAVVMEAKMQVGSSL